MDAWVVEVLQKGLVIPFTQRPPLSDRPLPMPAYEPNSTKGKALATEVQLLIHKGAIELAPQSPGFYSRLFVVQKDSGAWRPIIDLSTLNGYIANSKFHMETPQTVLRAVRSGDWMISVDLQDAYFQVPIHPDSRKYLRFVFRGVSYQFKVLCFGLTIAPQVFTRLMAPVSSILHRYGIRMLRYLDDWLVLADSRTTCLEARDKLLQVCEELGLQINLRKSSLIPSQQVTYLGMVIDSESFIARPSESRICNLLRQIRLFLASPNPPATLWRRLLGHLSSLTLLVKGGMLRMRSLQLQLRDLWDFQDETQRIPWDPLSREDLLWWSDTVKANRGVDLSLPIPDLAFYSDASDVGWGAWVGDDQVSGLWLPHQKEMSINLREMLAVLFGLKHFRHLLQGKTVALFCDNTTAVAYLRRAGGTKSAVLYLQAREILLWVQAQDITLLPQFIQGSLNVRADLLSRPNRVIGSEWTLHHQVVQDLLHRWPATIDLFATAMTARLPVFFAPSWEPQAAGIDALLQPWDNLQAYAFPPIAIVRRVLLKLRASHNCQLTLIAPFWPQKEWFPDLLDQLLDIPLELPQRRDLLRQPHFHRFHENLPMLRLTAWRLSSGSPVKPDSLVRWLSSLPYAGRSPRD